MSKTKTYVQLKDRRDSIFSTLFSTPLWINRELQIQFFCHNFNYVSDVLLESQKRFVQRVPINIRSVQQVMKYHVVTKWFSLGLLPMILPLLYLFIFVKRLGIVASLPKCNHVWQHPLSSKTLFYDEIQGEPYACVQLYITLLLLVSKPLKRMFCVQYNLPHHSLKVFMAFEWSCGVPLCYNLFPSPLCGFVSSKKK